MARLGSCGSSVSWVPPTRGEGAVSLGRSRGRSDKDGVRVLGIVRLTGASCAASGRPDASHALYYVHMTWVTWKFVWSVRLETSCTQRYICTLRTNSKTRKKHRMSQAPKKTRVSGKPVWEGVLHQPRQAKSHVHETKR